MTEPLLSTERLDLWLPRSGDHAGLIALLADDAVRLHLGNRPTSAQEEFNRLCRNAGSWALYGYGIFTVRRRGDDDVIGIAGVFHSWRGFGKGLDGVPEAGWIFARRAWGQGLATEAMQAVLAWFAKSFGPARVACMINDTNLPSRAVAARLGFVEYDHHTDQGTELVLLEQYV
ncbi:GNAT family N-acetyltransferase [Novosphingobium sp. FKTRR1]|uniref:GNAT family N-acetyltransferase n=1 Tax=Novosphingobium sp. FKTRR1 TaxID=2879118 RepID=UPI001CF02311|nr:GNAT family N-acetyltransferase [Novosphingobium sp. FKTRR1]